MNKNKPLRARRARVGTGLAIYPHARAYAQRGNRNTRATRANPCWKLDTPERSNRQVAAGLGVDDKTVAVVRRELETRTEIPHVSKTVDTLGRTQPARKPISTKFVPDADDETSAIDADDE